ncbi:MAG: GFA family protein, partial [Myxococcota bacterium]
MCRRRGTIVATVPIGGLRITEGADTLCVYQFNTNTAKHFFCSTCGIYTHHQCRFDPGQYGFNV